MAKAEFERKRAELDFENVWKQLANMEWHELKEACRYAYNAGRGSTIFSSNITAGADWSEKEEERA